MIIHLYLYFKYLCVIISIIIVMHSFSKSMIPKDGVLVAFPDVSFLNKHFAL